MERKLEELENAVKSSPGSYKAWYKYLESLREWCKEERLDSTKYEFVNSKYELALIHLSRMPRIWIDYTSFLWQQKIVTRTRQAYDRALLALPLSQHHRIWPLYISFAKELSIQKIILNTYHRYLMVEPDAIEEFIDYLLSIEQYDLASQKYVQILNDPTFHSTQSKTHHEIWMALCTLITTHPQHIHTIDVPSILRTAAKKFVGDVGKLWASLANYYILLGHLERARDVYEEGLSSVLTLRDAVLLYDAYLLFEQHCLNTMLRSQEQSLSTSSPPPQDSEDCVFQLTRVERLLNTREAILQKVKLKKNLNNVKEWLSYIQIFEDKHNYKKTIQTYAEAIRTIQPQLARGSYTLLWREFAFFYQKHHHYDHARRVFELAHDYCSKEDYSSLLATQIEMELQNRQYRQALLLSRRSLVYYNKRTGKTEVNKNVQLWSLNCDLEESFGSGKTVRGVYDRLLGLDVVTLRHVFAYAEYLMEGHYYEEAFRVFERGVSLFKVPVSIDLWCYYLFAFVRRYGARKLERGRELFEQALSALRQRKGGDNEAEKGLKGRVMLMYAHYEMAYGTTRRALGLLEKACHLVEREKKGYLFKCLIKKVALVMGVARTRRVFEEALESVTEGEIKEMGMLYAAVEEGLGEVERARGIYLHCSKHCVPVDGENAVFWDRWKKFELQYGNEDTYRDMLRVLRTLEKYQVRSVREIVKEVEAQALE